MRWTHCMALLLASGCTDGPPPDPDAGVDAASGLGGTEAGVDAGDDATVIASDAGTDAGIDAGPSCLPSTCVAAGVCDTAACVDDACVHTPVADGTVCDEAGAMLCVGGACVMRACGDGWREPGPTPVREGCDDGNSAGGDACTVMCAPRIFTIQSRTDKLDELPMMAADRTGALLVAWTAQIGIADPSESLRARRFDRHGVPLDSHGAPRDIATDVAFGWALETTIAGLDAGWVVAWTAPDGDGDLGGIRYVLVAPDGTVGGARTANETVAFVQSEPSVAALADGFVVSWTDQSGADADVRARRFSAAGVATGHEFAIATTTAGSQRGTRIASQGDRWLATWTDEDGSVRARRFDASAPVDAADFELAAQGAELAVSPLDSGDFVVAWVSRATDPAGDVIARIVHADGDPLASTAAIVVASSTSAELAPAVVALGADAFLATWENGGRRRGVALSSSDPMRLAPEVTSTLVPALVDYLQGDVALARGRGLIWAAGSSSTAVRSVYGFGFAVEGT